MNINTPSSSEAEEILSALQQIQENPELRTEAETNPEGVMDCLGVSGIARHAVALGIAGLLAAPVVHPTLFWN